MQFKFFAPIAGLLLLSSQGSCTDPEYTPPGTLVCNSDNVLRALRRFSSDAIPFCSDYIGLPKATLTLATVTPTITATITTHVQNPQVDKRDNEDIFTNRGSGGIFSDDAAAAAAVKRDTVPLPTYVSQYPASRVSSACSCLTIPLAIATATYTAPAETTTTTTTVPSDLRGKCETTYDNPVLGSGNYLLFVPYVASAKDCCLRCQQKANCVASGFLLNVCELVINYSSTSGPSTGICPLGSKNYPFGPAKEGGRVFAGPCGV